MPREEFEAYTSGQLVPPLYETDCCCHQAIKSMEKTVLELAEVEKRRDQLAERIGQFREKVLNSAEQLAKEVRAFGALYGAPETPTDLLCSDLAKTDSLGPVLEPRKCSDSHTNT